VAIGATVADILLPVGVDLLKTDVLPYLVALVDRLLGGKTQKQPDLGGSVKFPLVVAAATAFDKVIASLGTATPSTPAQIEGATQAMWQQLDAAGLLVGHQTILPPLVAPVAGTIDDIITSLDKLGGFAAWLKTSPISILPSK
jgi:hypothetical protein